MSPLDESVVEDAALSWFGALGYGVGHGPLMAPGEPAAERATFADVVLAARLREAIARLNPHIPGYAQEEALRKVLHPERKKGLWSIFLLPCSQSSYSCSQIEVGLTSVIRFPVDMAASSRSAIP